jgi:hypothetical protein
MYFAYANGICLIGRNIYRELLKNISVDNLKRSFLISAQMHFKDIRKTFLSGKSNYMVNKNIMRFLKEICVLENILDYKKMGSFVFFKYEQKSYIPLIIKFYKKYLTRKDMEILKNFLIFYRKNLIYDEIFLTTNKILKIFQKRFSF